MTANKINSTVLKSAHSFMRAGHVQECPTIHYFGILRQIYLMTVTVYCISTEYVFLGIQVQNCIMRKLLTKALLFNKASGDPVNEMK